jgi:PAS domain S-box-containing protein
VVRQVREKIVDRVIITAAIIGLPALAGSLARAALVGWRGIMYFHIVTAVLFFLLFFIRRKLPYEFRTGFLLCMGYTVGFLGLISLGLFGTGALLIVTTLVLTAALIGPRTGIAATVLSALAILGVGLFAHAGWIQYHANLEALASSPLTWFTLATTVLLFTGMAIAAIGQLDRAFTDAIEALAARGESLESSNRRLTEAIARGEAVERELREAESKFEKAFMLSPDAMLITRLEDGVLLDANHRFFQNTGFSRTESLGRSTLELKYWARPEERAAFARTLVKCGAVEAMPVFLRHKDGSELHYLISGQLIEWHGEKCIISVARNVSAIRRAEEERHHLERRIQHKQRIESLGMLAGSIAHDFRSFLTGITGFTELAERQLPDGHASKKYLAKVHEASDSANDLVQQVLMFSRQREGERVPVALGPLVSDSLKFLRALAANNISVRQHLDTHCPPVLGDRIEVQQVLLNLLTNAFQAMERDGGELEVSIRPQHIEGEHAQRLGLTPGEYVALAVRDTGCGMPQDVMSQIFEPYFTTKAKDKGTGLGLATVYSIVMRAGGNIEVESELGEGTCFTILLPAAPASAGAEPGTRLNTGLFVPAPLQIRRRVLLVDDVNSTVLLYEKLLHQLGYDVHAFTSSLAALEAFRNDPHDYDAVLTDNVMPDLSGIELAEAIARIRPDIPVFLMTGSSGESGSAPSIFRARFNKPLSIEHLEESFRAALGA